MGFDHKKLKFDAHGVPYLKAMEIEAIAYELLEKYCPQVLRTATLTPVLDIIEKLKEKTKLKSAIEDLGEIEGKKVLGKVSFARRTLFLDKSLLEERKIQFRFTAAHEIGHWVLHRYKELKLENQKLNTEELTDDEGSICRLDQRTPKEWIERQANVFAASLIMPRNTFHDELVRSQKEIGILRNFGIVFINDENYNRKDRTMILAILSDKFQVSKQSVEVRLNTLKLVIDEGRKAGKSIAEMLKNALS